jgi:hypothetical protein
MTTKSICLLLIITIFSSRAFSLSYPESFAFETSMEAAGQVLSSPALPSLDNDAVFSISPLAGTVKVEGVDESDSLPDGSTLSLQNRGTVNGQVAGLTLNYSGKGDLGFFAITAWSKVQGDMASYNQTFSVNTDVRNISAETYVGAIGLTYRLVGSAKSKFALGIFGGPAFIKSKTTSDIYHSAGVTSVTVNPDISGYYLGLQFTIRIGEFHINPYVNMLGNPNSQCLVPSYSGADYPTAQWNKCANGEHGLTTFAVLAGSGINIGYGRFQFGVATQGGTGSPSLKTTPLLFSFRIAL